VRAGPGHPDRPDGGHGPRGAAQLGILIKGPEVLESTRRVHTVVLDKTASVFVVTNSLRLRTFR
jgi:cation transport ATPase